MPGDNATYGFGASDKDAILAQIGNQPPGMVPELRPRGGGSGSGLAVTPAGGISAASGTSSPWTPGSATCTICEGYDDSGTWKIQTTSSSDTIYNTSDQAIAASVLIQYKIVGGKKYVDVASCGS